MHQANRLCGYVFASGCAVAANSTDSKSQLSQADRLSLYVRYWRPEDRLVAIDLAVKVYGIDLRNVKGPIKYDAELGRAGITTKQGAVWLGPEAFISAGYLGATLAHEIEIHVDRQLMAGRWWPDAQGEAVQEMEAYNHVLGNPSRFNLSSYETGLLELSRSIYFNRLSDENLWYVSRGTYDQYVPGPNANLYEVSKPAP